MKLLLEEFYKVITNKIILWIIFVLFCLNGIFCLYLFRDNTSGKISYSHESYKKLYEQLEKQPDAEQYIQDKLDVIYRKGQESYQPEFEDSAEAEYRLLSDVQAEVGGCIHYGEIVQEIIQGTNDILNSSISSLSSAYTIRNQQQIIRDYSEREEISRVSYGPSKGIVLFSQNVVTDFICILLCFIIIIFLVTKERDRGELGFYKLTYRGEWELALAKLAVIMISTLFIWACFYLFDLVLVANMYGIGDMSRPIQSVSIFENSVASYSVKGYLLRMIGSKLLNGILFSAVFYLCAVISKKNISMYILVLSVFSVEIACYHLIDANSSYHIVKYLNLYAFMKAGDLFAYRNLSICSVPFSYFDVYLCVSVLGILLSTWSTVYLFATQTETPKRKRGFSGKRAFGRPCASVVQGELYKLLVNGKGLLLLTAYLLVLFLGYQPVWEEYYIPRDSGYEAYIDRLKGPVTEEKIQYIRQEQQRFDEIMALQEKGEISEEDYEHKMTGYVAFEQIANEKLPYLQKTGGYFIHETGYRILAGDGQFLQKNIELAFCISSVLLYLFSYMYGMEYQNETQVFLRIGYYGGRYTLIIKSLIVIGITTLLYAATYLPLYISVLQKYGCEGLDAPANSLMCLSQIPAGVTLLQYLIFTAVKRYVGLLLMMWLLFGISRYTGSVIYNCTVGILVVSLPLALVFIGVTGAKYLCFNLLLL